MTNDTHTIFCKSKILILFAAEMNKHPRVKRKTAALIADLEKKPHLYSPYEREESTSVHVNRWLNAHTSSPEVELIGFQSGDIYEPKRSIATIMPRVSTSDTNIILGKRKRQRDRDDDDDCINKSSSETRLIIHNCRPRKQRKSSYIVH